MQEQRNTSAPAIPVETLLEWIAAIDHELGGDKRRADTLKRIKRTQRHTEKAGNRRSKEQ